MTAIGDLVARVDTWNPSRSASNEAFTYVDLSSVNQTLKQIVTVTPTLPAQAPSRARQIICAGDVIVSTVRPNLNAVAQVPAELHGAIASTGFTVLRPTKAVDGRYLFHWVRSPAFIKEMERKSTGASYPAVSDRIVKESSIPRPAIDEQRRIAAILDHADALRAKRRQVFDKLEALTQAVFVDVIKSARHRNSMRLQDAYWFQEGPGIRKWQFTDTGVKLLNVGNIEKDGSINLEKTSRHISVEESAGRYSRFLADEGDLVIASSGISFDIDGLLRTRGAFIEPSHLPLCMNTSTIRFKAIPEVSTLRYLQAWLSSTEFRSQITKLVTGSAQQNFGPTHLKQVLINLPEMPTQMRFARLAESVTQQRNKTQESICAVDAMFASIQTRAFQGEL